ncbi:cupin domain-containing protein [candidate division KSB1 bacterium]
MAENELYAKASRLAELAGYQDGTIVSKTIIKKKTGTVTFFAFSKGEGLSEHTAPFDALVFITDGRAEVTVEDNTSILNSGEIMILPANKPHGLNAVENFKMLLIMIRE